MKYCAEMTKKICDLLEKGLSREDAWTLCDVSEDAFYDWMHKSEFSEAVKKAELKTKADMIEVMQKAAPKSWQAAAWWLERKHKKEYAQRSEISGDPDAPVRIINVIPLDAKNNRNDDQPAPKAV